MIMGNGGADVGTGRWGGGEFVRTWRLIPMLACMVMETQCDSKLENLAIVALRPFHCAKRLMGTKTERPCPIDKCTTRSYQAARYGF